MVYKRRLEIEFNVSEAPFIPRAPRSNRKRSPRKELVKRESLCAFELLATVAGKLSEESEGSAPCNAAEGKFQIHLENEKDQPGDDKASKSESFDRGSCAESAFVPEILVQEQKLLSKKLECDVMLGISDEKSNKTNYISRGISLLSVDEPLNHKVNEGSEVLSRDEKHGDFSVGNIETVKDPVGGCVNTNSMVTSESSVKIPLYRDGVKLGIRDDDENSFGCNDCSTRVGPFRPQLRSVQRRVRKTMMSRYWKASPKLKDYEPYTANQKTKAFYRYRKRLYARERCQLAPIKKRKLSEHSFSASYECDATSRSISNMELATKAISKTKEHHVTVRIKSFKVPELYLEMPESATIGSLKRTVLEAITAILGGGIRVGIFFQGKKVRDDHRTLQQAGISQCGNLDNLGFSLEPTLTNMSSPNSKALPVSVISDSDQNTPRSLATLVADDFSNGDVDKKLIPYPIADDMPLDGADPQTMALVPVVEALAAVPVNQKPKISERRTRRPFSVAEVEALVEAVEQLGTGRWRDVKMRAFENADHRTYVDLKDKWKTLVHTASISPQQRRGEPVPHELLNRVLSADSYWSQHQSKPHRKPQSVDPPNITDSNKEVVVV